MYKHDLNNLFNFIIKQAQFIQRTTGHLKSHNDFMLSDNGMILFNSSTMCLQTIGEYIKQIDDVTDGRLFEKFSEYPWKEVIGMRHFISHEYLSVDPAIVFKTIKTQLNPLIEQIQKAKLFYNEKERLIKDFNLYKQNIDGKEKYFISCSINGIKQLRKEIDDKIISDYLTKNSTNINRIPDAFKLALCWNVYDFAISLIQERTNNRKL